MPMKGILALRRTLPSGKDKHEILPSEFGESKKWETHFHLWMESKRVGKPNDLQMHRRMTKGLQSGMRSKKRLPDNRHTNITKRSSRWKDPTEMFTVQISSEVTLPEIRRIPRTSWRDIPRKGCTSWTVALCCIWWDNLLCMKKRRRLFDRQAKFWIFRPPMALWSQIRKQRTLVEDSPSVLSLGRLCNELGYSCSWPSGETRRLSKGKKVIGCNIENFDPVVAVTKQKTLPSIEFSLVKGNFERENEVEDTMLDLLKPFTEGLEEDDASSSTPNAGRDPKQTLKEKTSWWQTSVGCHRCGERHSGNRHQE